MPHKLWKVQRLKWRWGGGGKERGEGGRGGRRGEEKGEEGRGKRIMVEVNSQPIVAMQHYRLIVVEIYLTVTQHNLPHMVMMSWQGIHTCFVAT